MGRKPTLDTLTGEIFTPNDGSIINLRKEWERWQAWLDDAQSFRYVSSNQQRPFSLRKEIGSGKIAYWYAYRKEKGQLVKIYVGTGKDLTVERLDAIAISLTEKLQNKVTDNIPVTKSQGSKQLQVQLDQLRETVEKLQAESQQLREQFSQLQAESEKLRKKLNTLDSNKDSRETEKAIIVQEYQEIRDRLLSKWRVKKQGESKERFKEILDKFIDELGVSEQGDRD